MNKTGIEWADWTWNPISGCSPISAGCDKCYAAAIAKRFKMPWGAPVFHPERLGQPAKVRKPGRVFCGSMTDLGHDGVDPDWRRQIADAMRAAPWHTYIVLTKRPGPWLRDLPSQCWVGVTMENHEHASRWPLMYNWSWPGAPVRVVSVEPMLGPVTFVPWWGRLAGPDWVICGPETGPGARPCEPAWIEALAAECDERSVPFFDKRKVGWIRREFPA